MWRRKGKGSNSITCPECRELIPCKKGMALPLKAFLLFSLAVQHADQLRVWLTVDHPWVIRQDRSSLGSGFILSLFLRTLGGGMCMCACLCGRGVMGESWVTVLSLTLSSATKSSVDPGHMILYYQYVLLLGTSFEMINRESFRSELHEYHWCSWPVHNKKKTSFVGVWFL